MRKFVAAILLLVTPVSAIAGGPTIYPVQLGKEDVRFRNGVATVSLQELDGGVQITPLPMDHGELAFGVAVFNGTNSSANIDVSNFRVEAGGQAVRVLTAQELIKKAQSRAAWAAFAVALAGGISAAAESSRRNTYTSTVYTPRGTYRLVTTAPSAAGQLNATAIAAGTGVSLALIKGGLDQAIDRIGDTTLQLTTVDPGETYAGRIVLSRIKNLAPPMHVRLILNWAGREYVFEFELAKKGTAAPAYRPITYNDQPQPAMVPPVGSMPATPPVTAPVSDASATSSTTPTTSIQPASTMQKAGN